MSAEAEMTSPGHGGSEQEEEDWDNEDGNAVIARGWPRNPLSLAKHGLRPVWTSWGGYPEDEIPEDIKEFLDETGNCSKCVPICAMTTDTVELTSGSRALSVCWLYSEPVLACGLR